MGASVIAYWPGMTEEQCESMPGFWNDDRAWGNWMAELDKNPAVSDAVRKLKAEAILTYKTDGMDDDDVSWVSPQQLRDAATQLREAVQAGSPETRVILETYERNVNRINAVAQEFIRDLDDIIAMTDWAEKEGAIKMTLQPAEGWKPFDFLAPAFFKSVRQESLRRLIGERLDFGQDTG
jgi:hypothetical protein